MNIFLKSLAFVLAWSVSGIVIDHLVEDKTDAMIIFGIAVMLITFGFVLSEVVEFIEKENV